MKPKHSRTVRVIAFIAGWILILLGGIDALITTIPGIALVIWSLSGEWRA